MRIEIVHFGALQPGGYPPDTRALASALAGIGHDVTLIAEPGPRTDGLGETSVVPPGRTSSRARPDVVHLMGLVRPRQIAYVKRAVRGGVPLVISPLTQLSPVHLNKSRIKKVPYVFFLRRALAKVPLSIHGFSPLEIEEVLRHLTPASTFVAPSGVFAPPDVRWDGSGDYLLFFGRNDIHQKGLDLLLEGYRDYRAAGGRTRLVIAGQPWKSSEAGLRRLAPDGVEVVGEVPEAEKWSLMAAARALFFLSRWDGPPRPIREAISIGCPVVVTPGTHMADIVEGSKAGMGVSFEAASVCSAMLSVDIEASRVAWARGAGRLRARLAWDRVAHDYEEGYRGAADSHGAHGRRTDHE